MPGMACSALHPLIHIGYGYSVANFDVVAEGTAQESALFRKMSENFFVTLSLVQFLGLAYLHHSCFPFKYDEKKFNIKDFGNGSETIESVLASLRQDRKRKFGLGSGVG